MRATVVLSSFALSIGCAGAGSDVNINTVPPDQHIVPGVYREIAKLPYDRQADEIRKIREKERDFKEKASEREVGVLFKTNIEQVLKNNEPGGENYGKKDKDREKVINSRVKILAGSLTPTFNSSVSGREQKKKVQNQLYDLGHSEEIYRFNNDSPIYEQLEDLEQRVNSPLSGNEKERFLGSSD